MQIPYSLQIPQQVHSGVGAAGQLRQMLLSHGATSIGLFVDRGVMQTPLVTELRGELETTFACVTLVTDVPPEPEEGQVRQIFSQVQDIGCDAIVAIGGGSVMDTCKLIAAMLTNPAYREDLTCKEAIVNAGVPLIAVPTSAGTGSEATPNAIVLLPEKKLKVGIVHPYFMPTGVILDPRFTVSMPKPVTAATGIDAFCHCIETFISKKSNPFAELFACKGLELISQNLRRAYNDGGDMKAREAMLLAAFYGGAAITASSTVGVHALSYPLGGTYRIAHGVSNAILLAPVMCYNIDAITDKLVPIARAMGIDVQNRTQQELSTDVTAAIRALVRDVDIPQKLTGFGVKPEDVDALTEAASGVHRLLDQNPKAMSKQDIKEIYLQLL